jgi:hypothetical protein
VGGNLQARFFQLQGQVRMASAAAEVTRLWPLLAVRVQDVDRAG